MSMRIISLGDGFGLFLLQNMHVKLLMYFERVYFLEHLRHLRSDFFFLFLQNDDLLVSEELKVRQTELICIGKYSAICTICISLVYVCYLY